jgi:hypothetical protein
MSLAKANTLGVCLSGNRVYYAVSSAPGRIERIGQYQFQFPALLALKSDPEASASLKSALSRVVLEFNCAKAHFLVPAELEVWTTVARSVYDEPDEREGYLAILGEHINRRNLEPTWYPLSNREFRLLIIRDLAHTQAFEKLVTPVPVPEYLSAFECGIRWSLHSKSKGNYLIIQFDGNRVIIASLILGKLRGATHFPFLNDADLPFLWLHHAQFLHWMKGIHDTIIVFGTNADERFERLRLYLDQSIQTQFMRSPADMKIDVEDKTYGFDISEAWPAVLAALEV